ncbi:MAG: hypothetical protein Q9184_001959 [Pyrenodesmia sp. 2 TL-2023]
MAFKHSLVRAGHFDLLSTSTSEWDIEKILAVGESIPAYRYSATFLSTLRSNIHLSTHSDLCSNPATPIMSTFSSSRLPHPTPSPLSLLPTTATNITSLSSPSPSASDPLPTLATYPATTPSDRTSALHLIADSIAQQRQLAAQALITHPYPFSITILLLGLLGHYLPLYTFITTAAGTIMALLLAVRYIASPYLTLAESINFNWLEGVNLPVGKKNKNRKGGHSRSSSTSSNSSTTGGNVEPAPSSIAVAAANNKSAGRRSRNNSNSSRGGAQEIKDVENVVVVTKWGEDEIIGALVMRVLRKEQKAVVRAWTVKGRYRGHGVGRGLLEEGVRVAREKGCVGGGVEFDGAAHANSHRVLPEMFNKGFDRREKQARKMLEEVVKEQGLSK